jgi:ankyrin repeat domain-containing protein 50
MLTAPAAVISYFFCKHDEAESLKARTIIGSVARLLFSCMKLEVVDKVDPINTSFLDTDNVLEYLRTLLPSDLQEYFIIIDGLDECNKKELKLLIEYLKELLTSTHIFHIYCSSRPDVYRWVPALLRPQWNVSMSEASSEIAQYIERELEERLESGSLCLGDPTIILTIQDALVKGSQGMLVFTDRSHMPPDWTC